MDSSKHLSKLVWCH